MIRLTISRRSFSKSLALVLLCTNDSTSDSLILALILRAISSRLSLPVVLVNGRFHKSSAVATPFEVVNRRPAREAFSKIFTFDIVFPL